MATVDPGGYGTWRAQLRSLRRAIAGVPGPLVVAGDLNTSRFRPEFTGLLDRGLHDVHDLLGRGLRPSFRLSNDGVLAKLGPVARLDHALVNRWLHPVAVDDLEPNGSDHLPFVVTLAVRTTAPARRRLFRSR
jgi:endonuclease/exonuclease/phosphatase (EEP) superfamily protein YafD